MTFSVAMAFLKHLRSLGNTAAVTGFFEGLSRAVRLSPKANPSRYGIEVHRDIPYRSSGHPSHCLDIWMPSRVPSPSAAVLYVHGGGFRILSKESHWVMALAFARAGYVVFNINYRLAPRNPFPAALEDTCAAYLWMIDHASEYGIDRGKIAVAGESAGANLVTSLAIAACMERPEPYAKAVFERGVVPKALLPACGLLQVSEPERFFDEDKPASLVKDQIQSIRKDYLPDVLEDPDSYALADPLSILERDIAFARIFPPVLAIVGGKDPIRADTYRLQSALEARACSIEVQTYEKQGHAFHAFVWRKESKKAWENTFAFLNRHMDDLPNAPAQKDSQRSPTTRVGEMS